MFVLSILVVAPAIAADCTPGDHPSFPAGATCKEACVVVGDTLECDFSASPYGVNAHVVGPSMNAHDLTAGGWTLPYGVDGEFCCVFDAPTAAGFSDVILVGSSYTDELRLTWGAYELESPVAGHVHGAEGVDFLRGSSGDDELLGGPGYDRIEGLQGNDLLCGDSACWINDGEGDDLFGGDDDDVLCDYEGVGAHHFDGGDGNDDLWLEVGKSAAGLTVGSTGGIGWDTYGESVAAVPLSIEALESARPLDCVRRDPLDVDVDWCLYGLCTD